MHCQRMLLTSTAALLLLSTNVAASGLTYLTCTVTDRDGVDHVTDFTLDESNSTVSYYVADANATNVEKAVFGPETITWGDNSQYVSSTRIINRVDLSFTEEVDVVGNKTTSKGSCVVKTPASRKI